MDKTIRKYLERRADLASRTLVANATNGVAQVVVIPALAEKDCLFHTIEHLAANPVSELRRTLVICVVNNPAQPPASAGQIADNRDTLALLIEQMRGRGDLRIGYVDAASPGCELPDKGGVGLARKIGLDWGLSVLAETAAAPRLLFSLDADTRVEPNYLAAVRRHFAMPDSWAAVVSYAHRLDEAPDEIAAIVCYELFLRYHVLGLHYARSPYAFPSIGSTMVCRAEAYAAVSGMNQRQAGEDFYFMQKLAKTGRVDQVLTTTVHPSARASSRVPFGTGRRVGRHIEGVQDEYRLYDPRCYDVLKDWLSIVADHIGCGADGLLERAGKVAPPLRAFLEQAQFRRVWPRLEENSRNTEQLLAQFHRWFDGFRTIKLIHYLRDNAFPLCGMFPAIAALLDRVRAPAPVADPLRLHDDLEAQKVLLEHLRELPSRTRATVTVERAKGE